VEETLPIHGQKSISCVLFLRISAQGILADLNVHQIYAFSYVKLIITLSKYTPQAWYAAPDD